jgi:hypothetical protein
MLALANAGSSDERVQGRREEAADVEERYECS